MDGITPEQNVVGILIADLHDAKNQSLIWRNRSKYPENGNKNQQMLQKAATKMMFRQWPTM
ncbi:MAG TPA: DUF4136 domain-containing protein [Terriglobales bacterium]|nr:DUF4136 domain-containing protein [Terriglobales bacterium]